MRWGDEERGVKCVKRWKTRRKSAQDRFSGHAEVEGWEWSRGGKKRRYVRQNKRR